MKYTHIVSYVRDAVWALLPAKMEELLAVLAFRAAGGEFTAAEIQARIGAGPSDPQPSRGGVTVIVPLRGVIAHRMGGMNESSGGMSAERFMRMMQAAAADSQVSSILIDIDSPGGTVNGVTDAAQAVYDARQQKPIVALANGQMASAAYWIGSQAHEIVAVPGLIEASIGSIGAYTIHTDLTAALEKEGVKPTVISAGKHKFEGNPFEPLSDETRAVIQARVDSAYERFLSDVARGRGVGVSAVRNGYGEGRTLAAADAKKAGLVDRIATMDATLARLSSPTIRGRLMNGARAEVPDGEMFAGDELELIATVQAIADLRKPADAELARRRMGVL